MEPVLNRRTLIKGAVGALATGAGADWAASDSEAAEPLPQRVLGRTGVKVPILGFGTAPCGLRRSLREAAELYNEAIDLGVTYLDTAATNSGYGRAQEQLGHVLKDRRKEVFLVTKCHTSDGDTARRLLDQHLKDLQADYADVVHIHSLGSLDVRSVLAPNGIYQALRKAKADGKLRFIGVSGHHRPGNFVELLREAEIDVMMCAVNFVDRHTYDFESRVFPVAAQKNVGLVAMKVFGGMTGDGRGPSNSMMPAEHHDLAVRYALSLPQLSLAVIGMATREELHQNIARIRKFQPLTPEERQALEPVGKKMAEKWGEHFGPVA